MSFSLYVKSQCWLAGKWLCQDLSPKSSLIFFLYNHSYWDLDFFSSKKKTSCQENQKKEKMTEERRKSTSNIIKIKHNEVDRNGSNLHTKKWNYTFILINKFKSWPHDFSDPLWGSRIFQTSWDHKQQSLPNKSANQTLFRDSYTPL